MQINAYLNLHKTSSFLAHCLHIIKPVFCILVRWEPLESGSVEQYQRVGNIKVDKDGRFIY